MSNIKSKPNSSLWIIVAYLVSISVALLGLLTLTVDAVLPFLLIGGALIMLVTTSALLPYKTPNRKSLVIPACVMYAVILVTFADIMLESANLPQQVGDGFSAGNGILLDGLAILAYYPVDIILGIIGSALLVANTASKIK